MADIDLNTAELESSFRRALEAFNQADWPAFRELIAPDCVYEELGTEESFSGIDEYVARVQTWRQAFPDMTGTVESLTAAGSTVVAELTWRGTHTGPLESPMGAVPATGKTLRTRAAMVVENDPQGRAARVRHYTNPLLMMTQLGLVPAASEASSNR